MWPERYADETWDCAFRFLTECWWTDDDERRRIALIPAKPHIEQYVDDWVTDFKSSTESLYEKSRRTLVSWSARGLETWAMGRVRGSWLIVDQKHENAEGHLWRIHFSLGQLMMRRPELGIREHRPKGLLDERRCTSIVLPNGSLFTESHQEAGAVQGAGKTGVTLEELSKYRNPLAYWGQAIIVAKGGSGKGGGWVNGIANPSMNPLWRELKEGLNPRQLLGWE